MTLDLTSLLAPIAAAVFVAGVFLAGAGLAGWEGPERRRSRAQQRLRAALFASNRGPSPAGWWDRRSTRLSGALIVGLLVWLFSGWPVGGLFTAAVIFGLPWMLGSGTTAAREITRIEALEEWVRRLSDIHTVGVSVEQSIRRGLHTVPAGIKSEVTLLVSRMAAGWHPEDAYRDFADQLNDAAADEVVALLILHIEDRGSGLSAALKDLASGLAQEAISRREIEADREKPRTNDRWVTALCLAIFGLSMLSGTFTDPYATTMGQLVLAGLGAAFVAVKVWMRRMAMIEPPPRFLAPIDRAGSESRKGAA